MPESSSPDALRGVAYWQSAARLTAESWRESFVKGSLAQNVLAGVTVALVALPLNLALAIACGLPPAVGLWTGAIAGVLGAVFGGARLQVTGPEVALAPLTLVIVGEHGFQGLLVVTLLAGVLQIAFGLLRIGRLVELVPVPVIGGFLAAVGLSVFDSQIPRLLGLPETVKSVSEIVTTGAWASISPLVVLIGATVAGLFVFVPRLWPRVPGPLLGLVVAIIAVQLVHIEVPTVDAVSTAWPAFAVPDVELGKWVGLLPQAIALALLASIDSLLCAASVDARLGGPRIRSDQELVAQGLANMVSGFTGGMPVAAAVVRSMAAIDAGATSRLAPLMQSVFLAAVVAFFGSHVTHVPVVALAAILLVVGFRLIDVRTLSRLWKLDRYEAAIFIGTAVSISLTDFVTGVGLGVVAALAHFAHRQGGTLRAREARVVETERGVVGYLRLEGPLFFAGRSRVDGLIESVDGCEKVIVDLSGLTTVDATGAEILRSVLKRLANQGSKVWVSGATSAGFPWIEDELVPDSEGEEEGLIFVPHPEEAVRQAAGEQISALPLEPAGSQAEPSSPEPSSSDPAVSGEVTASGTSDDSGVRPSRTSDGHTVSRPSFST